MKNCYSIAERNRIVEENLHRIDRTIRRNRALMKAAHLDRDDVYQQLAIRLIRAVDTFDPDKGELAQHLNAQLQYEMLSCKDSRQPYGFTGVPYDPDKSELVQLINAQLQYELLNCTDSRTRYGLTGAPRDLRGAVISLEACGDMPCYDLLAA